jgi:N-acetylglucosamine-6-phosphate deacetylase
VLAGRDKLAGSALRMDRGIENLMRLGGVSLADAVRTATTNAARAGGLPGRTLGLEPGQRADFVLFRFDPQETRIEIAGAWMDGRKVA